MIKKHVETGVGWLVAVVSRNVGVVVAVAVIVAVLEASLTSGTAFDSDRS